MSYFYFNPHTKESCGSQWINYLQNNEYVKDIKVEMEKQSNMQLKTVELQTSEIKNSMQYFSQQQIDAIKDTSSLIANAIESGFEKVSSQLESIGDELSSFASMFDWKMTMLIEEQRITNVLSENIALLLRIP